MTLHCYWSPLAGYSFPTNPDRKAEPTPSKLRTQDQPHLPKGTTSPSQGAVSNLCKQSAVVIPHASPTYQCPRPGIFTAARAIQAGRHEHDPRCASEPEGLPCSSQSTTRVKQQDLQEQPRMRGMGLAQAPRSSSFHRNLACCPTAPFTQHQPEKSGGRATRSSTPVDTSEGACPLARNEIPPRDWGSR